MLKKTWRKYWLLGVIGLFVGLVFAFFIWREQTALVVFPLAVEGENLTSNSKILGAYSREASGEPNQSLGVVYGFLPYWTVDNYQLHQSLTHLSYFRLAINGKGEIVKDGGINIYQSEQFGKIVEQVQQKKLKMEMTFFTSQSDEIAKLLKCRKCQDLLINNIGQIVGGLQLDGVNLDLEYLGYVSEQERDTMSEFIFRLKTMLDKDYPRTKLSIDVYGGAANMNNLWDFPRLGKVVDRIMVMAYDYKTKGSSVPGPSSPTLGKSVWGGDIWEDVRSLARFVPSEKIILVVPFYGYAWETTTGDLGTAKTWPDTGETMTYRGAQNLLKDRSKKVLEKWDEKSLTPYLVYYEAETDRWHMGFFENERSLGYKIDLIKQLRLGGIAIWALGYEGDYKELWDVIGERF